MFIFQLIFLHHVSKGDLDSTSGIHKALLGPQLQQGGVGTNSRFPCLLAPPGGKLVPLWGEGGRASMARQEG